MKFYEDPAAVSSGDIDQQRADGFKASVSKSYRVWPNASEVGTAYRATPSFVKAYEWLREGLRVGGSPSLQVLFRWRLRDAEGDGRVSYLPETHPDATSRFVEAEVQKLIARAISDSIASGRFLRVRPEGRSQEAPATNG